MSETEKPCDKTTYERDLDSDGFCNRCGKPWANHLEPTEKPAQVDWDALDARAHDGKGRGYPCFTTDSCPIKDLADAGRRESEERKRLESVIERCMKDDYEIDQTLGKALGYPWYKDDQRNFPGATEADGVCTGDHVPATLAVEAAKRIATLERELEQARASVKWLTEQVDMDTKSLDKMTIEARAGQATEREVEEASAALTEIEEGRGPFKMDNHDFALSVIENVKEQAKVVRRVFDRLAALARRGGHAHRGLPAQPDPEKVKAAHEACPCRPTDNTDEFTAVCCLGKGQMCTCWPCHDPKNKCIWPGHAAIDAITPAPPLAAVLEAIDSVKRVSERNTDLVSKESVIRAVETIFEKEPAE